MVRLGIRRLDGWPQPREQLDAGGAQLNRRPMAGVGGNPFSRRAAPGLNRGSAHPSGLKKYAAVPGLRRSSNPVMNPVRKKEQVRRCVSMRVLDDGPAAEVLQGYRPGPPPSTCSRDQVSPRRRRGPGSGVAVGGSRSFPSSSRSRPGGDLVSVPRAAVELGPAPLAGD